VLHLLFSSIVQNQTVWAPFRRWPWIWY